MAAPKVAAPQQNAAQVWQAFCEQSRDLGVALATMAAMELELSVLRHELGEALTRAKTAEQALAEYVRDEEA